MTSQRIGTVYHLSLFPRLFCKNWTDPAPRNKFCLGTRLSARVRVVPDPPSMHVPHPKGELIESQLLIQIPHLRKPIFQAAGLHQHLASILRIPSQVRGRAWLCNCQKSSVQFRTTTHLQTKGKQCGNFYVRLSGIVIYWGVTKSSTRRLTSSLQVVVTFVLTVVVLQPGS